MRDACAVIQFIPSPARTSTHKTNLCCVTSSVVLCGCMQLGFPTARGIIQNVVVRAIFGPKTEEGRGTWRQLKLIIIIIIIIIR